jgi:hypothetical protein
MRIDKWHIHRKWQLWEIFFETCHQDILLIISNNINKTNNNLSLSIFEHKIDNMALEI